ncbi:MAG: hypothetical protein RLZZ628_4449, partial [Bacteroidota bacterium]
QHPYRWATIGKEISHIEEATMDDVKSFFYKYYLPNNAILVVAGDITLEQIKQLCTKWFEPIPAGEKYVRNLPKEKPQTAPKFLETSAKVPLNAIYKAYHMPGRFDENFYNADLLSDVLGRGKSSRLYTKLVKEKQLFNNVSGYVTASLDPGLLMIQGNLNEGVSLETADAAIEEIVADLVNNALEESELQKVKNQSESTMAFSEVELLNRAMNLAFAANAGNVDWCNDDAQKIASVTPESLQKMAKQILRKENSSTMYYRAEK